MAKSTRSTSTGAGRRPAPKTSPQTRRAAKGSRASSSRVASVEVKPGSVEKTLAGIRRQLTQLVNKGRYTKVRFKLRGKQILPDIPVGAVIAAEAATFWWAGLLRALLVTVGAKAVLDMEMVSDADREVALGKEALLTGDLDRALNAFHQAIGMDDRHAGAHLSLGVALKLKGDLPSARRSFQKAEALDPRGPVGEEARRLLEQIKV